MEFKIKDHEQDWHYVRECVFMKEQGFENEFDEIDAIAIHVCVYEEDKIIGCGRIFPSESDETIFMLGRLAVLKEHRKAGYARHIVAKLEELAKAQGAREIHLSAQCGAKGFYAKANYVAYGEEYMDEHCLHIAMKKIV